MEIIEQIKQESKKYFEEACPSHDWSHVERVYDLAEKIAEKENADLFVVKIAALLHDIGRKEEMQTQDKKDHTEISKKLDEKILKKYKLDKEIIEKILKCISTHRFRNNKKPESKEAEILYDADKLDLIGAIGVARAYAWAGKQGTKLYSNKDFLGTGYEKEHSPVTEFKFKLRKVKDTLFTETAKEIAEKRNIFMEIFFKNLEKEIEGEL